MKILLGAIIALTFTTVSVYADDNCTDTSQFPTIAKQCSCIMNNAVTDCKARSPIKAICNPHSLANYFRKDVSGAEAQCEKYGGEPSECVWSVPFYDTHC